MRKMMCEMESEGKGVEKSDEGDDELERIVNKGDMVREAAVGCVDNSEGCIQGSEVVGCEGCCAGVIRWVSLWKEKTVLFNYESFFIYPWKYSLQR